MRPSKLWSWLIIAALCCSFAALAVAQEDEDEENEAAGAPRKRAEWFYDQRAFPSTNIPAGSHARAVRQAHALIEQEASFAASTSAADPAASTWAPIGPQPLASPFWGGNSGRITSIAVDPANNNIAYAAAADGGLWKTLNGGTTWTPIADSLPTLATGAVALAPSSPNIVYLGTGESNFAIDNYSGNGIYKSTDSGATWTRAGTQFTNASVGVLAVHPTDPNIVLAGAYYGGVYRSTDGGDTWTNVISGWRAVGTFLWFDPHNGNSVYAAMGYPWGDSSNGVYHSNDAGATWAKINGTAPNTLPADLGRIALGVSPSNPNVLYAGIQAASSFNFLGAYKSTDGGANWTRLWSAPAYCGAQCWYDNVVAVHPTNPNVSYFGGAGNSNVIVMTADGGTTWSDLTRGANGVRVHSDVHSLTISGNKLYVGTDGGAWSTTDLASPAPSWTNLNSTLNITQFYPGISIRQNSTDFALAGTQDNGTLIYSGILQWNQVACGDGMYTAINPQTPTTMYVTCQGASIVQRSVDGGSNWSAITNGITATDRAAWVLPIAIDPAQPTNLYFGTYRLYQSRNGGSSWAPVSGDLTGGCTSASRCTISTMAVAPSDSNTVYVGTLDGHLQVTNTALSTATFTDRRNGLPMRAITRIVVSPASPLIAWATFSGFSSAGPAGHVFATTDGGSTWTSISGNLPDTPANDLEVDPDYPNTFYVATDVGVFRTIDGGTSWSPLASGLPLSAVQSIRLFRAQRILRAATHGRGMWDLSLGTASDIQLAVGLASGQSTLNPGASTSWPLTVSSSGGFNGPVSLSCSGAPSGASCEITPASANVSDSAPLSATVTLTTTARSTAQLGTRRIASLISLLLLTLGGLCTIRNRRALALLRTTAIAALFAALFVLLSCGGGGDAGSTASATTSTGTPAGTYTLTITATTPGGTRSIPITVQVK